jgi:hypothetical protein
VVAPVSPFFHVSYRKEDPAMKAFGYEWMLTKHGRQRLKERIGDLPDHELLKLAIYGLPGYIFTWKKDREKPNGRRLVTVLVDESSCITLTKEA